MSQHWIGVDLDGTLAHYDDFIAPDHIGAPIPLMLERVKKWRAKGKVVKIFSARISHPDDGPIAKAAIESWCLAHLGEVLDVTCIKDWKMTESWDDRAIQVRKNTGERVDGKA